MPNAPISTTADIPQLPVAIPDGGDPARGTGSESGTWMLGVTIESEDLDRAAAFYAQALGVAPERAVPGRVFLSAGDARLVIVEKQTGDRVKIDLYFASAALDDLHTRVIASGGGETTPISVSWSGERSFGCVDPDGNRLWFVDARTLTAPAA